MKDLDPIWSIFSAYLLLIFFILLAGSLSAQVVVTEFTADWNKKNEVEWLTNLKNCKISKVDIVKYPKAQKKHGIVIVPTIIIFNNGEEIKRFQADLSFKMVATRKEVQEEIDNLMKSKF